MRKNDLLKKGDAVVRILGIEEERCLIINCVKPTMPRWVTIDELDGWEPCAEGDYHISDVDNMTAQQKKVMHERYTLIAPVLPFISMSRSNVFLKCLLPKSMLPCCRDKICPVRSAQGI